MNPLNPLLTSPLRLGVMSLLIKVKSASFKYLKEELDATQGNLSVQLKKLKEAEYISIKKIFETNLPSLTKTSFENSIASLHNSPV